MLFIIFDLRTAIFHKECEFEFTFSKESALNYSKIL